MRSLEPIADDPAELMIALRSALSGEGPALLPFDRSGAAPADAPREVPKRVAVVVQTSGSAGVPKSVGLSADALLASAAMTQAFLGGPARWVLALPAHYVAGLQVLVRSIASETQPIVIDPGFGAADLVQAIESAGRDALALAVVPAQLARIVDAAEVDAEAARAFRRLQGVLVGGQRAPADLLERARALDIRTATTYGSSETAGGCVYDRVPLAGVRMRIDDGELLLSSPTLAEGYLDDAERTERTFFTDGDGRWYRTGDAARIEEDGRLTVLGRLDDVIISGGEKVSLGLVERSVREVSGFDSAVVVRAPHERWGEVPVVVVEAVHADSDALPRLRDHVRGALGRAAAPDRILALDVLPQLASGKPDRQALALLAAAAQTPVVRVSAVLIRRGDGRALLVRKRGSRFFMQPGGKPEAGETAVETAIREVAEEVGIELAAADLVDLGVHRARAANEEGADVVADSFEVLLDDPVAHPSAEIAEAVWVDPGEARSLALAPLTAQVFVPLLASRRPGTPTFPTGTDAGE